MENGTILVLNGTSSSGKSSILRAFQALAPEPYLNVGLDQFLWMLPRRYFFPPLWSQVFEYTCGPDDPQALLEIRAGPLGHRLVAGMHQTAVLLAQAGHPVVLDHVLLEKAWLLECSRLFTGLPAYLVGVRCPLEVLEQRERERRDRTAGQARAQFAVVHAGVAYDLEVDTAIDDPETCARTIYRHIESGPPPSAFAENLRRLAPVR